MRVSTGCEPFQADVSLAVIQIPFQSSRHGDRSGRAHHGCIFGERIRDAGGRGAVRAEHRVARFVHDRNGDDLLIAKADQDFAQAVIGFGIFETRRGEFRRGQARGKFVDTINSGHFFDEVYFARDVAAP